MSYVLHFLSLEPGEDWVDALEEQERAQARRLARDGDRPADIVRSDWWRIAAWSRRVLPDTELRRTRHGLTIVDRSTGLALELEQDGIELAVPYCADEERAREALTLAQQLADFVEGETGLTAIDPQLGRPFLGVEGAIDDALALIATTRRAMAGRLAGERGRGGGRRAWDGPRPRVS